MLHSEAVDWTVANYKPNYADCFDIRQFKAKFFDGRSAIMYDRQGAKHHTDIGGWNRRWNLMRSCFPGYTDRVLFMDIPLVRHEVHRNYVLRLVALLDRAEEIKGLVSLDACCLDRPYEQFCLAQDADSWSRLFDFEL